jgi:DNA-directed RNA polymerase subunit RPC12/RpoP
MMKPIQCAKCGKEFAVEGGNSNADQVPRTINCPYCKEPNQVLWPVGMGYRIQTLPR